MLEESPVPLLLDPVEPAPPPELLVPSELDEPDVPPLIPDALDEPVPELPEPLLVDPLLSEPPLLDELDDFFALCVLCFDEEESDVPDEPPVSDIALLPEVPEPPVVPDPVLEPWATATPAPHAEMSIAIKSFFMIASTVELNGFGLGYSV